MLIQANQLNKKGILNYTKLFETKSWSDNSGNIGFKRKYEKI